jgi:hypothetical protein
MTQCSSARCKKRKTGRSERRHRAMKMHLAIAALRTRRRKGSITYQRRAYNTRVSRCESSIVPGDRCAFEAASRRTWHTAASVHLHRVQHASMGAPSFRTRWLFPPAANPAQRFRPPHASRLTSTCYPSTRRAQFPSSASPESRIQMQLQVPISTRQSQTLQSPSSGSIPWDL